MSTLLEAIGIMLETYFRFGFPNESSGGDNLRTSILPSIGEGGKCGHALKHTFKFIFFLQERDVLRN